MEVFVLEILAHPWASRHAELTLCAKIARITRESYEIESLPHSF